MADSENNKKKRKEKMLFSLSILIFCLIVINKHTFQVNAIVLKGIKTQIKNKVQISISNSIFFIIIDKAFETI